MYFSAVERKLVKKGSAAVDSLCSIAESSHVFEEDGVIWDCMLNQVGTIFCLHCIGFFSRFQNLIT